jgi:DNA-binding phage protein
MEERIKKRIAISLNKLLQSNEKLRQMENEDSLGRSYGKIALNADIRKATVSDTFNAKSIPSSATLILIIEAMGFSILDFAKVYEAVTEMEIKKFKN